ncbi:MAG: hypothetical protein ACE5IY_10745 [bacterium]
MRLIWPFMLSFGLSILPPATSALRAQAGAEEMRIARIQSGLEDIRGSKFKHPIKVATQSREAFGQYIEQALERQIPAGLLENYDKVVRKLGLYRGPEIEDFRTLARLVVQSQAAAYYDPEKETFFVVMQELPDQMLNVVYAHELYHGLQDQNFDLETYLVSPPESLNDDELLARQSVVEGEATYVSQLWAMKNLFGTVPDRSALQIAIRMQAQMGVAELLQMVKSGAPSMVDSDQLQDALHSLDDIPGFMLETMLGPYFKGMGFVFEIHALGWEKVEALYGTPPMSTEQILHPEKWLSNEIPMRLSWPGFEKESLFVGWNLLEANTLGELRWRIIFAEHDLVSLATSAAAGWNGDSYAVLEQAQTGELLLLIASSWDSEKEATEFAQAYEQLLSFKYAGRTVNTRLRRMGTDVLILEGGEERMAEPLLAFIKKMQKKKEPAHARQHLGK